MTAAAELTVADRSAASRAAQGLPPTITDTAAIARLQAWSEAVARRQAIEGGAA